MAAIKNENAAIDRAMKKFKGLDAGDKQVVRQRLTTGQPAMGLVDMAYCEEVHAGLSPEGKSYMLSQIKKECAPPHLVTTSNAAPPTN